MSFSTQQAVYKLTGFNGYQDIKRFQEPLTTELGKDDVLIKVKAVSLNYRNLIISKNQYLAPPKLNVVPGSDASGDIAKVGDGVTNLSVGDRVITNFDPENFYGPTQSHQSPFGCMRDGVLTQYKVISKHGVNKIPKDSHLTDEEVAILVCTGVTVWNALFGSTDGFVAGQTVLILGTGGVDHCVGFGKSGWCGHYHYI
jgi:NADPH:quinone reductase-like Zn-dependent oxidoreductase